MAARTLTQHLLDVGSDARGAGYAHILSAVSVAVKLTAATISRGPLVLEGATATAGEDRHVRLRLRRLATGALLAQTAGIHQLAGISIAGTPRLHQVSPEGRYLLLIEAMHGMSNLADNLPVGSAFSLLERTGDGPCTPAEFLQPGHRQVAAGIALYGPRTVLVMTTGDGVDGFTLDRDVGNFVLTHPRVRVPADARMFAINATEAPFWPAPVKRYVEECMRGTTGPRGQDFSMRWNASALVGAYRVLVSGGLFLAPRVERPGAWLSPLLHNAAPLALLAEQAGGAASTGTGRVLNVVPVDLGTRTPLFLGSTAEVERLERYVADHASGTDREFSHPLFHNRTLFAD